VADYALLKLGKQVGDRRMAMDALVYFAAEGKLKRLKGVYDKNVRSDEVARCLRLHEASLCLIFINGEREARILLRLKLWASSGIC
jgi:hypothetical protein